MSQTTTGVYFNVLVRFLDNPDLDLIIAYVKTQDPAAKARLFQGQELQALRLSERRVHR